MAISTTPTRRVATSRKWKWFVLVLAAVALFAPTTCTADSLSAADSTLAVSLPPGAIAYAEVSSLASAIGRIEDSAYLELLRVSPQFQKFAASEQYRKIQAVRQILETNIGTDLWTAGRKLLAGRTAVAIYPNPAEGRPGAVVLIDDADPAVLKTLQERIQPFLALAEQQIEVSEPSEGTQLIALGERLFVAIGRNWAAAASQRQLMDRTIELRTVKQRTGADSDSLAKDESFQTMLRQLGSDHALLAFLNTETIHKVTGGKAFPQKFNNPLVALLLGGILDLAADSPYAALTLDIDKQRFVARLGIDGDSRQLDEVHQAFFSDPHGPGTPAIPNIPHLIGGFAIHRDVCRLYRQREQLVEDKVLPAFDKFETGLSNLLPGKNFAEDVLPLIGSNFMLVAAPQSYDHLDGEPGVKLPGFGVVIELTDPEKAADLFQLFFQTFSAILNIQATQQGRQPWVMASETHNAVQISFGRYLQKPSGERLATVFNFTPASARVGNKYIVSSSLDLCRQLVDQMKAPASGATGPNRNLNFEFNFAPFVEILSANEGFFKARAIQQGRDAEQAAADFAAVLDLLGRFESARFSTSVKPEIFQVQFEGNWK